MKSAEDSLKYHVPRTLLLDEGLLCAAELSFR